MCNTIVAQNLKELRNYLIKGEKSSVAAIQLIEKSEALFKQNKLPYLSRFLQCRTIFHGEARCQSF